MIIKLAKPMVRRFEDEQAVRFLENVEILNDGKICPFEELNENSLYGSEAVIEYFGIEGIQEIEADEELADYNERVKRLMAMKMPAKILAQESRMLQEMVEREMKTHLS